MKYLKRFYSLLCQFKWYRRRKGGVWGNWRMYFLNNAKFKDTWLYHINAYADTNAPYVIFTQDGPVIASLIESEDYNIKSEIDEMIKEVSEGK